MAIRIPIVGEANFRRASAAVGGFASESRRRINGIGDSFRTLNTLAAGFVSFLAVRQVVRGLDAITQAASVQEDAINQLNTSLRLAGTFSLAASESIQQFAAEIERTTRFGDELVIQQVALARNFARTNEEAIELTRTAIDLSEATGISLDSAVRNLGKTFSGLVGELGELVPQVRGLTTEQLQAGEAVRVLSERFGGAAQERVRTFSGATQQLSNTFGSLQEALGKTITQNPNVIRSVRALSETLGRVIVIVEKNSAAIQTFVTDGLLTIVTSTPIVLKTLNFITQAVQGLGSAVTNTGKLIAGFAAQLVGILTGETVGRGSPLLIALEDITSNLESQARIFEIQDNLVKEVTESATRLANQIKFAREQAESLADTNINVNAQIQVSEADLRKQIGEVIQAPIRLLFEDFDKLTEGQRAVGAIASGLNAALNGAQGAVQAVSSTLGAVADTILPGIGSVVSAIVTQLAKGPEAAREFIRGFVEALPDIIANIITAIPAVVEAFVEAVPVFVERLVQAIPQIIEAFVRLAPNLILAIIRGIPDIVTALIAELPRLINELIADLPSIAAEFVSALVQEAPRFVTELIKALGDSFTGPFSGGGDSGGGFLSDIPIVGDLVGGIEDTLGSIFLSGQRAPQELQPLPAPDSQLASPEGGSGMTVIQLRVGEKELANVMLELNRKGFRTV